MSDQQSSEPREAVTYTAPDGTTFMAPKGTLIAHLMKSDIVYVNPGCMKTGLSSPSTWEH